MVCWVGVEGAGSYGAALSRHLPASGSSSSPDGSGELQHRPARLVERRTPQLLIPVGIGPYSAVTLLITMGNKPERLGSEASFAALCGVSLIEHSSGRHHCRRLNRGGGRQANAAPHTGLMPAAMSRTFICATPNRSPRSGRILADSGPPGSSDTLEGGSKREERLPRRWRSLAVRGRKRALWVDRTQNGHRLPADGP
ncbi:transposase [Streptomyces decoyicus]|uniref:transposase n=1 Tax=Streptomyces decoyicus TaxID=249567 RepID=UPI00386862D5|nr:IS110 family transposase [Streptomyces decoyicus]